MYTVLRRHSVWIDLCQYYGGAALAVGSAAQLAAAHCPNERTKRLHVQHVTRDGAWLCMFRPRACWNSTNVHGLWSVCVHALRSDLRWGDAVGRASSWCVVHGQYMYNCRTACQAWYLPNDLRLDNLALCFRLGAQRSLVAIIDVAKGSLGT